MRKIIKITRHMLKLDKPFPGLKSIETVYIITDVIDNTDYIRQFAHYSLENGVKEFVFTGRYAKLWESIVDAVDIELKQNNHEAYATTAVTDKWRFNKDIQQNILCHFSSFVYCSDNNYGYIAVDEVWECLNITYTKESVINPLSYKDQYFRPFFYDNITDLVYHHSVLRNLGSSSLCEIAILRVENMSDEMSTDFDTNDHRSGNIDRFVSKSVKLHDMLESNEWITLLVSEKGTSQYNQETDVTSLGMVNSSNEEILINSENRLLYSTVEHQNIISTSEKSSITILGDYSELITVGAETSVHLLGENIKIVNKGENSFIESRGGLNTIISEGEKSIVAGLGRHNAVKAAKGNWIILTEWRRDEEGEEKMINIKAGFVDDKEIKANTMYKLVNGKFKEIIGDIYK